MANKYQVTDSKGQVHKRTSLERTYTHCVVVHLPPWKNGDPARSRAEWARTLDLAEKNARSWRNHAEAVEIIEAVRL